MASGKPTIKIIQGDSKRLSLQTGMDLTGYQISSQIRDATGALIGSFTCTDQGQGIIELFLAATTSALLTPGNPDYAFDVRLESPTGEVLHTPRVWLNVADAITEAS